MTLLSPHEADLLSRIKATPPDSGALVELINLHTGIYHTIAAKYARTYPDVIKLDDLTDDRMTNMYQWVISYNPEKGMKLGSYVGEMTDYMCRGILKKERHNPLSPMADGGGWKGGVTEEASTVIAPITGSETDEESTHATSTGKPVFIVDETASSRPADEASTKVGIEDILTTIADPRLKLDARFRDILKWRHFTEPARTWRAISKDLSLSHEGARKVYNKGIEVVRTKHGIKWESLLAQMGVAKTAV